MSPGAGPAAGADRYAVAGHPVAHSRSPAIHRLFAAQTGQALAYGLLPCPPDRFAETVRAFAASVGADGSRARGCNVTVPFKFDALALAARATERAALAQAVNTLRFDADGWQADNTDGAGLVRDITLHAATPIAARDLLLIGAGGAAAGVLGPLLACRPARLVVANRSPDKADALAARHADWAEQHGVRLQAAPLGDCGVGFDIVVNATAASLGGGGVPVDAAVLRPGSLVVDMMYGAAAQPFLDWAVAHGAVARDGLGMLVEQAAEAFLFWRGVRPETAPVLAALRDAIARGLPP